MAFIMMFGAGALMAGFALIAVGGALLSRRAPGCLLAKPRSELQAAWPEAILAMDPPEQCAFADAVARQGAADPAFCTEQLEALRRGFPSQPPNNATGVGNLAYLARHAVVGRGEYANVYLAYMALLRRNL